MNKGAEAQARYRARHPERVATAQREYDASPERKERQRLRARAKRATPEHKAKAAEYRRRPDVVERRNAAAKTPEKRAYLSAWSKLPHARAAAAARKRRQLTTPKGRLNNRMRAGLARSLGSGKSGASWESLVGYSVEDLRRHLERQFVKGMTWENMGEWHVDHVLPLSSFNFSSPEDPEFRAAWALANLRPLWKPANLAKGARREHLL